MHILAVRPLLRWKFLDRLGRFAVDHYRFRFQNQRTGKRFVQRRTVEHFRVASHRAVQF